MRIILGMLIFVALAGDLVADVERANYTRVFTDEYGECFAKSVPAEEYGDKGATFVYRVDAGRDRLLHVYDWYARQVYIHCLLPSPCPHDVYVVRFGPWQRGHRASSSHLAIALYLNGRLLNQYSTIDIAGAPDEVKASSNHYEVIDEVRGYVWEAGRQVFRVRTVDGRMLDFDMGTGVLAGVVGRASRK